MNLVCFIAKFQTVRTYQHPKFVLQYVQLNMVSTNNASLLQFHAMQMVLLYFLFSVLDILRNRDVSEQEDISSNQFDTCRSKTGGWIQQGSIIGAISGTMK